MANSRPTLSGLDSPVTYLENTVNAAPQIIDSSVTFTDPDDNFATGTLTVTRVTTLSGARVPSRTTRSARRRS